MNVLITGGSGFLGVAVARALRSSGRDRCNVVLTDIVRSPRLDTIDGCDFVEADIADPRACEELVTAETGAVFHFASLVSGGAERDFAAGMRANVFATVQLLEACRKKASCPRFIFTSSIATFGGADLPETVDDTTQQHPQNSYGVAKTVGEQLLNDYSRKGFIDGRGVRLPAIVVRDEPNSAASGYASGIIREPLQGRPYTCPVTPDTRIPILSVNRCVELLTGLFDLPAGSLGDFRTVNGPSISPAAQELADSVRRAAPDCAPIRFDPDPAVQKMVGAWPRFMLASRADALGFTADPSSESIVRDYLAEMERR